MQYFIVSTFCYKFEFNNCYPNYIFTSANWASTVRVDLYLDLIGLWLA